MIISAIQGGKYCLAKATLDSSTVQKLSSLPGFKKWVGRDMLFAPTGANIDRIRKYWPGANWDESTSEIIDSYIEKLKEAELTRATKNNPTPEKDDFMFETRPFEHQRKAFYISREKKSFALLMEQGTGKSKIIIDNAAYLYSNNKISALIIIAPNGVHRNWVDKEIPYHMPNWCHYESTYYYSGMNKKDSDKFQDVMNIQDKLRIFTFNVEAFVSKTAIKFMSSILISNTSMLVVDESSRIKRPGANRTRVITKFESKLNIAGY